MYSEIRGINIKQVIWKIILGWKKLLVVAVACAIILTGFKYRIDSSNYDKMQNAQNSLSNDQIIKLDTILMQYDRLSYYEKYFEDSLLLKIDAKQYDILEIQYYVDSKYTMNLEADIEKDYTPTLVSTYGAYVLNSEYAKNLINELKLDASIQSVRELIQVVIDKEASVFKLSISIPTGIDVNKLENAVDKLVFEKQEEYNVIGEHSLFKINSAINKTFSDSLEKKIYEVKNNINNIRNNVDTTKENLSDEEKLFLYNNMPYDEYRDEYVGLETTEAQVNVKFAVVGFILGAFVVCAFYLMKEVFSSKLQNEDDIYNLYKIDKLGVVKNIDAIKNMFFIDRMLMSIKNKKYNNGTTDDIIRYTVIKVEKMCKIKGVTEIVFVETAYDSKKLDILERISMELKNVGIVSRIVSNILQDCESLKTVIDVNNTVIIGELDKTYYSNLEESIAVLCQYNVNILGNIIIE